MTDNTTGQSDNIVGFDQIVAVFLWGWAIFGASIPILLFWFFQDGMVAAGTSLPNFVSPLFGFFNLALVGVPALLLALFWKNERYKAIFTCWALAVGYGLFMLPLRLISFQSTFTLAGWQIVGSLLFAGMLWLAFRRRDTRIYRKLDKAALFFALALAALGGISWLAWGALGSWTEAMAQLIASLLFGVVAALLLTRFLFDPLWQSSDSLGWNILAGGMAAGAALLILIGAFGVGGQSLLYFLTLPAWGLTLAGIYAINHNHHWAPIALAVGLLVAIPYLFIDPDELALILNIGSRDILTWALYAAAIGLALAWLFGILALIARRQLASMGGGWWIAPAAALLWLAGAAVFYFAGQPGWHGEELFIVMANQADVSQAAAIDDPAQRRASIYSILTTHANNNQADIRQYLENRSIDYQPYYLINAIRVEGGAFLRWTLSRRDDVDRVLANPALRPLPALPPVDTGAARAPAAAQWNLTNIGATQVWSILGVRGEGVVVGQSDSGVEWTHPELQDSYRGADGEHAYNWFDPWTHSQEPFDLGGHGTHTLGSVLGNSVGVAPDATWFGCSNLMRNLANPALYLDCLQFMLAPHPFDGDPLLDGDPALGANVLNNSWGCPELEGCDAESLHLAALNMRHAGIFVVASAGNSGPGCESIDSPLAIYDEVFSVGAIDEGGTLASFSSRGPVTVDGSNRVKPDIVAPGVAVLSSFPNHSYERADGTSMAGPHIAGVVALIWSANPQLIGDIDRTEQILIETAQPYTLPLPACVDAASAPNSGAGYGIVDAFAAVQQALNE